MFSFKGIIMNKNTKKMDLDSEYIQKVTLEHQLEEWKKV